MVVYRTFLEWFKAFLSYSRSKHLCSQYQLGRLWPTPSNLILFVLSNRMRSRRVEFTKSIGSTSVVLSCRCSEKCSFRFLTFPRNFELCGIHAHCGLLSNFSWPYAFLFIGSTTQYECVHPYFDRDRHPPPLRRNQSGWKCSSSCALGTSWTGRKIYSL